MNKYQIVIISSLLLVSCSSSKKLLNNEIESLRKEIIIIEDENQILKGELKDIELALEQIKIENEPIINVNPILTLDIKPSSITSQINELEQILLKDAGLHYRFISFKSGGVERSLGVSHVDMQRVIKEAKTYLGTKHVMGGISHNGIDCSGLLYISFQDNGITNIPRTAEDFARYGNILINTNNLQSGDLVFFTNTYRTSKLVTHAGICIGNGEFIHTSSSKGVMISKINDPYYWRDKFIFGTRIVN